jgi:hypothetical protein
MAIRDDSPEIIAAHKLPAARPAVFGSLVPLLYAGIGVALGTLTGLTLTFFSTPDGAPSAFHAATTVSASAHVAEMSLNAQSTPTITPTVDPKPASVVEVADTHQHTANAADSASNGPTGRANSSDCVNRADCSQKINIAPAKTPDIEDHATPERIPAKERQPRSLIHPFARNARPVLAALRESVPEELDEQPVNQDEADKSPQFYTEGDLTVADFDAADGTIETSDGRTFVIGATVSATNATSWDDYRSSVHYRCGENGNCMLQRAGVVALNARII